MRASLSKLVILFTAIIALLFSALYPGCGSSLCPDTPLKITTYSIVKDIEYGQVDGSQLLLDIYIPDEPIASPMPAVVYIHGGGWRGGTKFPSRVTSLVSYGFLCISVEYRLSGTATFPAAIEDCKCAVRWLRANAETYGVDPDRIGVWGGSAGGHLALLVATADSSAGLEGYGGWDGVSSQVQAVCSYWGPSDFVRWFGPGSSATAGDATAPVKFLGGTYDEIPYIYGIASPVSYVTADDPPLLLVHGALDPVVPYNQSELMYLAYKNAGIEEVELVRVSGAGHGLKQMTDELISPSKLEIEQMVLDFFIEYLLCSQ